MSTTTARGRRKRSRDQGDSAAATSSDSAAATSTSQLHTDSLAHLAAAYAAVDGYAVAREEKAAQRAARRRAVLKLVRSILEDAYGLGSNPGAPRVQLTRTALDTYVSIQR